MSKLVTVKRLRAIYAFLIQFPPFDRWGMPSAGEVVFELSRESDPLAEYFHEKGKHHIRFSAVRAWSLPSLVSVMAHEAAHLKQNLRGELPNSEHKHHNAAFHRIALRVCEHLGFNRDDFV